MADKNLGSGEVSLISGNTVIEGKIKSEGSVRIDGKVIGSIVAKANAAIGATGVIEGDVAARNISVAGRIVGTVVAAEKLSLEAKSIVQGDIRAAKLIVEEGAMFDGHCAMTSTKQSAVQVEAPRENSHRRS
jgi:cytoskeletal protein CcmA (bactofilin family)